MSGLRTAHRGVVAAALTSLVALAGSAWGQSYPSKAVRVIAPISPGGGADTAARLLARVLTEALGQPLVIDNRPGAGSALGTAIAAKAPPDGYSILWISSAHAINAAFARDLPYDSIKDFAPVALLAKLPLILVVHPSFPARSVPELLALLRAHPGKYNYASSGLGSSSYLGVELLKLRAKVDMTNVSYKGAAPSLAALLGGEVQMAMTGPLSVKPHVAAGKLRPLAISTPQRSPAFPDLPSLQEGGVANYDMTNFYAILAPAGTPAVAIERLNREINAAQRDKTLRDAMTAEGAELIALTATEFGSYLGSEIVKYRELRNTLNMRLR